MPCACMQTDMHVCTHVSLSEHCMPYVCLRMCTYVIVCISVHRCINVYSGLSVMVVVTKHMCFCMHMWVHVGAGQG